MFLYKGYHLFDPLFIMIQWMYIYVLRYSTERIQIKERGNQIVHLQTNIILLGLQKASDFTLILTIDSLYSPSAK